MSTRTLLAAVIAAVAISALFPTAAKADVEWTGAADDGGNVLTDENWSGNAAPGSGDTAAIGDAPEANLSNGSATYKTLKLGNVNGKTGALTVGKDGVLTCQLYMGEVVGSASILNVNGGKVTCSPDLWTRAVAADRRINISDGELTAGRIEWGNAAQGNVEFMQSGGTVALDATLHKDHDFMLGRAGPASYTQTGGDLIIPRWFSIGSESAGNGTYTITGGTLTLTNTGADLQIGDKGKGVFAMGGDATVTVARSVNFGNASGASGTANLNGGRMKASGEMNIGNSNGASGVVNMGGGSLETQFMNVGKKSGASGTLNLSGGSMNLSKVMHIGYEGDGTVTQNGGIVTESDTVKVGFANTSTSSYTLDAGTNQMANAMIVGDSGNGFFMMGGGTLKTPQIKSGSNASGRGRVFLNGGTFMPTKAGSILANGSGTADWTLGRDFTIDTDGKDVSSAVSLAAASGSALTKDGEGKLTLAALPLADSVTVAKGTLALSSGGDNTKSIALAHRWSFSGNADDSVGGATGKLVGTAAYTEDGTAVSLPGGNNGASYVNLGKGIFAGDNLTLEFWAKRLSVKTWARVFECGTSKSNFLMASWVYANDGNSDKLSVCYENTEYRDTAKMAFSDNEMVHLSIRYVKNSDGTMTMTWTKRSVDGTGAIVKTSTFTPAGLDKNWTLDKVAQGDFFLGHSAIWNDNDANAVYDEVRVWHGALSDDALTLSAQTGPDATAEQIAAIAARNDESMSVDRIVAIASGATLDLGGNTLKQPVLDVGGTLANGKLVVAKGLVVTPGQAMTVADGATLDLSAVTEVSLKDASAAIPAEGWVIATSPSGTIVPAAEPRSLTGDLKGYTLFMRGDQARIGKRGLMILFR